MSDTDHSITSSQSAVMSLANASQRRFETMFDALGEGVVYQNSKGEIVIHNAAATEILGLTSDELEGRTSVDSRWQALRKDGPPFPGDQHPAMVALQTGERQTDVLMNILKSNGTRTWIKINSIPLFDSSSSEPIAAVTSFSDVSAIMLFSEALSSKLDELRGREE